MVTGAGHRLGRAIALELARNGYALALHYHASQAGVRETTQECQALGVPAFPLRADLSQPAQVAALFEDVDRLPHLLMVLVNSAAVMTRAKIDTITPEAWDATLALNLRAPFLCAREAARRMAGNTGGGAIINVTDIGARKTWTGYPAYAVSKAGLEALTLLLARAFAPQVRVNAVAPGLVLPAESLTPQEWQRLVARVPMKRAAKPEEIAQAVAFLIDNEYITGQILAVDGGYQYV